MDKSIRITNDQVLAGTKYNLRKVDFEYVNKKGQPATQTRMVFDRGDGAAILLYNRQLGAVILTRQFRLPSYLNGNTTGMLIEAAAGELDKDRPEEAIRREAEEETGYQVGRVEQVFEAYMSPGAATEIIYCFIGEYSASMKVGAGGGLEEEQEEIEVLEIAYERALQMVRAGEIRDAKTIMLLQYMRVEGLM